jgi:hypothetical protein
MVAQLLLSPHKLQNIAHNSYESAFFYFLPTLFGTFTSGSMNESASTTEKRISWWLHISKFLSSRLLLGEESIFCQKVATTALKESTTTRDGRCRRIKRSPFRGTCHLLLPLKIESWPDKRIWKKSNVLDPNTVVQWWLSWEYVHKRIGRWAAESDSGIFGSWPKILSRRPFVTPKVADGTQG